MRLCARDQERLASDPSGAQAVRIVVVSDTHDRHERCYLPEGDILVHCGDFTSKGTTRENSLMMMRMKRMTIRTDSLGWMHAGDWRGLEKGEVPSSVKQFNEFLGTLPHKHKIVIAGTFLHEGLDDDCG